MQARLLLFVPLVACAACPTNLQQHAKFAGAEVAPGTVAEVGDVVSFEVRPDVPVGSEWELDSHGRARFVGREMVSHVDWVASGRRAIALEAIVSPWDPQDAYQREAARGWLWFGLKDSGASQSLDRDLPVTRVPFREIAAVTVSAVFSLAKPNPRLSVGEDKGRVIVKLQTPVSHGFPYAPRTRAMILETNGKKRLYAEVKMNYGDRPKEPIGYEVTLSYPVTVGAPMDVVVVEWLGHGWYYGPFNVHRATVGGPSPVASGTAPSAPSPTAAPTSTTVTTIPNVPVPTADGGPR